MAPGKRGAGTGFTLLELAIVVAVVAVLASVALERLLRYAELAEKSAMEQTIAAMKSALSLRFAAYYLKGRSEAIRSLPEENPMDWLAERPPNYLGALWNPPYADLERPSWYYDRAVKQLVYLPLRTRHLAQAADGETRIRYRVIVDWGASVQAGSLTQLERLGIDPVVRYDWFESLP
jgi:general secretion pathway protein G